MSEGRDKYEIDHIMPKEDIDKFLNMDDESKIKTVESLLYTVENNKYMEKTMKKLQDRFENFNRELSRLTQSRKDVEENVIKIAEDLEKVKEVNKVIVNAEKKWIIDEPTDVPFMMSPPFAKLVLEGATVSTILSEYLKLRGITQIWLADQIKVDKTTIINIIKKPQSISLLNAYKISKLLGEDIEILFPFIQGE